MCSYRYMTGWSFGSVWFWHLNESHFVKYNQIFTYFIWFIYYFLKIFHKCHVGNLQSPLSSNHYFLQKWFLNLKNIVCTYFLTNMNIKYIFITMGFDILSTFYNLQTRGNMLISSNIYHLFKYTQNAFLWLFWNIQDIINIYSCFIVQ